MSDYEKAAHARVAVAHVSLYHDQVAEAAKGGDVKDLPQGYYLKPDFLGTLIVRVTVLFSIEYTC
jgi:hypothetical protein